jgi:hypothetical protein
MAYDAPTTYARLIGPRYGPVAVVWTRAFYERFLGAVEREASKWVNPDGSFELGWTLTIVTARVPRAESVRRPRRTARGRRASGSGSSVPRGE